MVKPLDRGVALQEYFKSPVEKKNKVGDIETPVCHQVLDECDHIEKEKKKSLNRRQVRQGFKKKI